MVSENMTDRERSALAEEIASAVLDVARPHSCACNGDARTPDHGGSDWSGLAGVVDYCLEGRHASSFELGRFIEGARRGGFRSVCVPPRWAAPAVRALRDLPIRVSSVIGQPNGASLTPAKCAEAECLLRLGVDELWMAADTGGIRSGDLDAVFIDIRAVAELASCRNAQLNVILEFPLFDHRQKVEACVVAKLAGAAGVVSAWGREGTVTEVDDVNLMRKAVGGELNVLAALGTVRAPETRRMLSAGANRVLLSHRSAG